VKNAHKAAVSVVAYDDDNNRFITGGFDKKVKLFNFDGTIVFEIGGFRYYFFI
jgi:WD40 repeat protein